MNVLLMSIVILFQSFSVFAAVSPAIYRCALREGTDVVVKLENRLICIAYNDLARVDENCIERSSTESKQYLKITELGTERVLADFLVQELPGKNILVGSYRSDEDRRISSEVFTTVIFDRGNGTLSLAGFSISNDKIRDGGGRTPRTYSCAILK